MTRNSLSKTKKILHEMMNKVRLRYVSIHSDGKMGNYQVKANSHRYNDFQAKL